MVVMLQAHLKVDVIWQGRQEIQRVYALECLPVADCASISSKDNCIYEIVVPMCRLLCAAPAE